MGICDTPQVINAPSKQPTIDPAAACTCDCCDTESPVLAIGGEQLHRVAHTNLKKLCQARTNNDRAGVISKVIKAAVNQLTQDIGSSCMKRSIDAVKIDSRILKSCASAYVSAQNR